jgi:hypothetical protein
MSSRLAKDVIPVSKENLASVGGIGGANRVILGRKTFHLAVAFRAALVFSIATKWRFWPPTIGGVGTTAFFTKQ